MARYLSLSVLAKLLLCIPLLSEAQDNLPGGQATLSNLLPQCSQRSISVAQYSPDGNFLVYGGDDLLVFDSTTRRFLKQIGHAEHPVTALTFSRDGTQLAAEYLIGRPEGAEAYEIAVFSFPEGVETARFKGMVASRNTHRALLFDPTGQKIATSNHEKIVVLSAKDGSELLAWSIDKTNNPNTSYSALDATPDWSYFILNLERVAYPEGTSQPAPLFNEKSNRSFFWYNLISKDGSKAIAIGGGNGTHKKLFDLESGALIKESKGFPVSAPAISKEFDKLASINGLWLIDENKEIRFRAHHNNDLHTTIAVHPSGNEITSSFYFLNLAKLPEEPDIFNASKSYYKGERYVETWFDGQPERNVYEFTEDGQIIAATVFLGSYRPIRRFDLTTDKWGKKERRILPSETFHANNVIPSPDGKLALSRDFKLCYPKASEIEPKSFVPEGTRPYGPPGFIGNKRFYFKNIKRNQLNIVDVRQIDQVKKLEPKGKLQIGQIVPSPDGRYVAMDVQDRKTWTRSLKIYVVENLSERFTGKHLTGRAAFNWDASLLAIYEHKRIDLYDIKTEKKIDSFNIRSGFIRRISFSPDSQRIVATNRNGLHEVINLATKETEVTLVKTGLAFDSSGQLVDSAFSSKPYFYTE